MLNLINNDQLIMEQYKTHMPILNDYDITQLERIAHLLQHCYPDHLCHSCKTSIGNLDLVGLDLACFSDCSEVDNVASTNSSSHEVL